MHEKEVLRLEKELIEAKEVYNRYLYGKEVVNIGVYLYDKEDDEVVKVTKLKNGCNDFEAKYVNKRYGRGYLFVVNNWRLATKKEIKKAKKERKKAKKFKE